MRRRERGGAGAWIAILSLGACMDRGAPSSVASPAADASVTTASSSAATASGPSPSGAPGAASVSPGATASGAPGAPAGSAGATGFTALAARYPARPDLPSGPGVWCGTARCAATEICCSFEEPRCLPRAREAECVAARVWTIADCDESSDCPGTERCCGGRINGDTKRITCATPGRCGEAWDPPGGYGLDAEEICGRGGRCKAPGTICVDADEHSFSGGACVTTAARARCGGARECPADRPWCLWDAETGRGECIPRGAWLRGPGVLECDDRRDCPGELCCAGDRSTFCSDECAPDLAYAAIACHDDASCGAHAGERGACVRSDRLPPWLGTCGWSAASTP